MSGTTKALELSQLSSRLNFDEATNTSELTSNLNVSANSTSDAVRITQTGTGNAFVVEDSASPDSTPFVIDGTGRAVIGNVTANGRTAIHNGDTAAGVKLDISGTTVTTIALTGTGSTTARFAPSLLFRRNRGTYETPTIAINGDYIGRLDYVGFDGSNWIDAVRITAEIDGTPGTNDMPGRLVFSTTADGASSPTERMRIDNRGAVGIGSFALTSVAFRLGTTITGGTTSYGAFWGSTVQPTVTASAVYNQTNTSTAANGAVPYTITAVRGYSAGQGTFNADSTVTNQYGFSAESTLTGATNNYGFYSNIASGTGRWNFYAAGTAANYFAGQTSFGTTSAIAQLNVVGNGGLVVGSTSTSSDDSIFRVAEPLSTYFTNFKSVTMQYKGTASTGTVSGVSNADLGLLSFTNVANALIQTNGATPLIFATSSVQRGQISGTGVWSLGATAGSESLRVTPVASAVNYVNVFGSVTGSSVGITAAGSDANPGLVFSSKGTGSHTFYTNTFSQLQFAIVHTASAVNYLQVSGGAAGVGSPNIVATGSDTNITITSYTKGTGSHNFVTGGGVQFIVGNTASAVNYLRANGGTTGNGATLSAQGSDTNIDLALTPKGTGGVGIGTSSPSGILDVTGTGSGSAKNWIFLRAGNVGSSVFPGISSGIAIGTNFSNGSSETNIVWGQSIGAQQFLSFSKWTGTTVTEQMRITSTGNVGIGLTNPAYKLQVNGSFAATTKSFVIDHPTKTGKKLRYGSLEGPENGVYVRGKLMGNTIELPEYWTKLVDPDSITVTLTPIGRHQKLYVKDIINNTVVVGNESDGEVKCFYVVYGERCDVDKLEVEID